MAKRILVGLDQTIESESIISFIVDAARGGGATVRLLHVAPIPDAVIGPDGCVMASVYEETARLEAQGLDYLATVAAGFEGIPVETTVRFGNPVTMILDDADLFAADLIALTSRRRNRLSAAFRSGIADRVSRTTDRPVLTMRLERPRCLSR
jgi:nucleotide-binding universal stress UspA family protein